ncbi:MAG: DUF3806 domain-containing protein [Pseudomonadales bacterium]
MRILFFYCVFSFSLLGGHAGPAQPLDDEGTITAFENSDEAYLEKQYELLQEIANNELAKRFNGEKAHDLELLQKLIDSRAIKSDQRRELQAMGVVLGRTLAKEYELPWVVFRDSVGRSRALQIDETKRVVFPMTMISRRLEVGARANVQDIYAKASRIIEYTRANHVLY